VPPKSKLGSAVGAEVGSEVSSSVSAVVGSADGMPLDDPNGALDGSELAISDPPISPEPESEPEPEPDPDPDPASEADGALHDGSELGPALDTLDGTPLAM
jgi:hypothetical protein